MAAAAGYLAAELAKELPYYPDAVGAAALTDSITSPEALLFLAGANLGAALYEFALARATRAVVRRRSHRGGPPDEPAGNLVHAGPDPS